MGLVCLDHETHLTLLGTRIGHEGSLDKAAISTGTYKAGIEGRSCETRIQHPLACVRSGAGKRPSRGILGTLL